MYSYFISILLFCQVFSYQSANAQEDEDDQFDLKSWISVDLNYDFHKKSGISFTQALRLNENSSFVDQIFSQISLDYRPVRFFKLSTGFRFSQEQKKKGYKHYARFKADASFRIETGRWTFKDRVRYTNKHELGKKIANDDILTHQLRLKTSVEYNIKKCNIDPSLSVELFNQFKEESAKADKIRIKLESDYKFKKAGAIGFFVAYEREFQKEELRNISILGINYSFDFKKPKSNTDTKENIP